MTQKPVKVRTPQAERTATMRQRLSEAAFEVIKEVGYANFRTSAVSKAAGVSQGAQLHHFPTKDSLTTAAMEYAYERAHGNFLKNISGFSASDDPLDAVIQDAEDFFMSDHFMVALDILMAGGKNTELRDEQVRLAVASRASVEESWVKKLIELGWQKDDAEMILSMTFCLVRGFAIKLLISHSLSDLSPMMTQWKSMVALLKANR